MALIPYVGGTVSAYWAGKDLERVVERLEQFVTESSARFRRLEAQDNLDKSFLETEEAAELVIEVTNKVTLVRDSEKRDLYASIVSNTARIGVNRSFYPTALKLLDALEPIHVEILRELLRYHHQRRVGAGEQNIGTRRLAIRFHLEALEDLRVGGLSEEIPEFFGDKLKGTAAWDRAIGQAGSGRPAKPLVIKALQATIKGWDDEILRHIWYLGKEGLVHQIDDRQTRINELGVALVEWLSEPED